MSKILVVTDTYYPDSRATIAITTHIAELLSQMNEVYVYPVSPFKNGKYPDKHNGVNIIINRDKSSDINLLPLRAMNWMIKKAFNFCGKYMSNDSKAFTTIHSIKSNVNQNYKCKKATISLNTIIKEMNIDCIITVSEPFSIHYIGATLKDKNKLLKWGAINFDPYSTSQRIGKRVSKNRYKDECGTYKNCDYIFMLSDFSDDYKFTEFKNKIIPINLPIDYSLRNNISLPYNTGEINCVYIGALYKDIRSPHYMLSLFSNLHDERINLYMYGIDFRDFDEQYFEQWKTAFGGRLSVEGRVSKEKANEIIQNADILVNIGNKSTNQCPSKVYEYIGTGKPIISFCKTTACKSEEILLRYPLAYMIYEGEEINRYSCSKLERFILSNIGKKIDDQEIMKLYPNHSYESIINTIAYHLQ